MGQNLSDQTLARLARLLAKGPDCLIEIVNRICKNSVETM